jgi:hypothetical protein
MSGYTIHYLWRSALAREGEPYQFPDPFTRFFRDKYSISAVYRWRVMRTSAETKEPIYIGEAEDLVRRIQRVRTPSRKGKKGDTNKRLNELFLSYLSAGRKIVLDIADVEDFEINGTRFGRDTMGDRFKRKTIENLLLAIEQKSDSYEILNVTIDPVEKARKALMKLKPSEVREVIRQYGLGKPTPK